MNTKEIILSLKENIKSRDKELERLRKAKFVVAGVTQEIDGSLHMLQLLRVYSTPDGVIVALVPRSTKS